MGPAFLNLKLMCQCLARAVTKHLEFSKGSYLFLEDLKDHQNDEDDYDQMDESLKFSYHFKKDLKLLDGLEQQKSKEKQQLLNKKTTDYDSKNSSLDNFIQLENKLKMQIGDKNSRLKTQSEDEEDEDMEEDLEREDDNQEEFVRICITGQLDDLEVKQIENIREEEMRKSILKKEEDKLEEFLKKRMGNHN